MESPFSFHCMICFEEFDIEMRYPVVLPCGHTYVCNQCAERLDKCMECRTPLVQLIPRGPNAGDHQHGNRSGPRWNQRQAGNRSPGDPPQPPIKKRLPLPKNVVLMSLIEATELATENVRRNEQPPSLSESPTVTLPNAILDADEEEVEKIKTGTRLAVSDCGTYAVANKKGLEIYATCPDSMSCDEAENVEEEVDNLVSSFHLGHKVEVVDSEHGDMNIIKTEKKPAAPVKLRWGDRVQVVSVSGGWAKLSRGYGFVREGRNQLVKVGSSVDRACKLEALVHQLSGRRKELRSQQKRVDNQFISLMNELQVSLMSDEDLTVIPGDTFAKKNSDVEEKLVMENLDVNQLDQRNAEARNDCEESTPLKPRPMQRPVTPPNAIDATSGGFFCSSGDVLDAVIPMGGSNSSSQTVGLPDGNHSSLARALAQAPSIGSSGSTEMTPTRILASAPTPSPGALRAGARAWREVHGRDVTPAPGAIDFRTGMSGHSALTRSSPHPHEFLEPRIGSVFRGFSNHGGLSMSKTGRSTKYPSRSQYTSHLAMPMFSSSHELDQQSSFMRTSDQTP